MAFNSTKTTARNQFVMGLKSRKTDKLAMWLNPADTFVKSVIGEIDMKNVTVEQLRKAGVEEKFGNKYFYVDIIDTTLEQEIIDVEDF